MAKRLSLSEEDFINPDEYEKHDEKKETENKTDKAATPQDNKVKEESIAATPIAQQPQPNQTIYQQPLTQAVPQPVSGVVYMAQPIPQPQMMVQAPQMPQMELPKESKTSKKERELQSIDLAGKKKLVTGLCYLEFLRTGKQVSLNSYVNRLIDEDIEKHKDLLKQYNIM